MLDLAIRYSKGPISLAEISERQGISLSYLEQLFTKLRRSELVKSTRGPGGGYALSRAANEITVASVITAVDEKVDTTRCGGLGNCQDHEPCLTHELWTDLSQQIYQFLNNITLGQLVEHKGVQAVAVRQGLAKDSQSVELDEDTKVSVGGAGS
jgi:Rrf2 family iron-sulfur cluster assembly transcriptional regulator